MIKTSLWSALVLCSVTMLLAGCPGGQGYRELGSGDDVTNVDPHGHDHDHGPNDGHVLVLGKYHGEVTFDASRVLTLYILGDDVKTAAPLTGATAILKLESGDNEQDIVLTAAPQEGDPEGTASRFTSPADAIPESIKNFEELKGEIRLTVDGQTHEADIHDHDDDHGHDH